MEPIFAKTVESQQPLANECINAPLELEDQNELPLSKSMMDKIQAVDNYNEQYRDVNETSVSKNMFNKITTIEAYTKRSQAPVQSSENTSDGDIHKVHVCK